MSPAINPLSEELLYASPEAPELAAFEVETSGRPAPRVATEEDGDDHRQA
jgi:hypothetical protein